MLWEKCVDEVITEGMTDETGVQNGGDMSRTALPRNQNHVSNSEAIPLEVVNYLVDLLTTSFRRTVRRFR